MTKLRLRSRVRRLVRRQQRQANVVGRQTERTFERYFFGRFDRLLKVRRFLAAWLLLLVLLGGVVVAQNSVLSGYYQSEQPVPGGIYREGIVGSFGNANPIYATSPVDSAVSKLIFSGLFKFNDDNTLVGDLAQSWSLDQTGQVYTIKLRPHLTWQDGVPLTADDVVYTYRAIQNPDAESPLRANWTGITVEATDNRTVVFYLPNPLSSFIDNLTNGIAPHHLLKDIPMSGLRSASFNSQNPVGAGPFRLQDIHVSGSSPRDIQERIGLLPFDNYWAGPPKLKTFTVHTFVANKDMLAAYRNNELTAMAGLRSVPNDIASKSETEQYNFTLSAANMVFFRTNRGVLKDKAVRQALVSASRPDDIIAQLDYAAPAVTEPFLASQFAYNKKYAQQTDDTSRAAHILDKAGWRLRPDGTRQNKQGQPLEFSVTVADTPENRMIIAQLTKQWGKIGVTVKPDVADDESFRSALATHEYDAIVYGITIGSDPDVFVYWDSSQNDVRSANRLNLSEYESPVADAALEAGRTRTGDTLRKVKYQPFLKAWQQDAPALGLYQPRFLYVSRGKVFGLEEHVINSAVGRYNNVSNWMIRTAKVTNDKK